LSKSAPSGRQDAQGLGGEAETLAERFLTARGLKLVARNVRCRGGEIDLVMQDGRSLVFVEVRLRTHKGFGSAAESVALRKQQRVILAAQHFLAQRGDTPPCRFDVIALDGLAVESIEWIRDAFSA
jgi:putative endonuclease